MTAEQAIRLSEICDQFEWGWRIGEGPRIEDVLNLACPVDRSQLLEDLLRIEVEMRRSIGEKPSMEDYRERFPERSELIESIIGKEKYGDDPLTPRIVGRYKLLEEIGRGRQGVVFRAIDGEGLAPIEMAIKLLGADAVVTLEDAKRFVREAGALARVSHPNIVPLVSSGDDRGQLYYVMKYIRGPSLERLIHEHEGPLDPDRVIDLLVPIVEAVRYLHDRGIVHRDLKPRNILMDEKGVPYVADFGLAFLLDGEGAEGGACGTLSYMAPEQHHTRFGEVGPKSDVYSLGVILYELTAGQPPFSRADVATLRSLEVGPLPPSRRRAGIPEELDRICLKCLRKTARDRYDAAQLSEDLIRFSKSEPLVHALPDGIWRRLRNRTRREPALYARLAVIVACSTILWGYRLITATFAPLPADHWAWSIDWAGTLGWHGSVELITVLMDQAILVAWGLASWAFQRRLSPQQQHDGLQLGWRVVDVTVLGLLIQLDDALMSPLTVAFAVLIVASAFWARVDQVLQSTLLAMAGYVVLAVIHTRSHPVPDHSYRHFHYLVGLACLGAMLAHQANRTRALARICESRNRA